jgi:hypothetical protein
LIVHLGILSLILNRWEGWPLLKAALTLTHKAGPVTLGDYRTTIRLSQFFADGITKSGGLYNFLKNAQFMAPSFLQLLTWACNKTLT